MRPIRTGTTNCILKGDGRDVLDLPVTKITFSGGIRGVESCWELTAEEKAEILKTGKLYFLCLGNTHLPILPKVRPEIVGDSEV